MDPVTGWGQGGQTPAHGHRHSRSWSPAAFTAQTAVQGLLWGCCGCPASWVTQPLHARPAHRLDPPGLHPVHALEGVHCAEAWKSMEASGKAVQVGVLSSPVGIEEQNAEVAGAGGPVGWRVSGAEALLMWGPSPSGALPGCFSESTQFGGFNTQRLPWRGRLGSRFWRQGWVTSGAC